MSPVAPQVSPEGPPYILLGQGTTRRFDKTMPENGTTWVSRPLGKVDGKRGTLFTLRQLFIEFMAGDIGTLTLNFSSDGGASFGSNYTISLSDTGGGIKRASVAPTITGEDIRFKMTLPNTVGLVVVSYEPVMIQRGNP